MNRIKQMLTGKRFVYGTGAVAATVGFIAIAIVLNLIAGVLVDRFGWKVDLTENKLIELSPEAKEVLKGIEKPVTMTFFIQDGAGLSYQQEILELMTTQSPNLTLRKVDPLKNPGVVQKFTNLNMRLDYYNVAFECGDNVKMVVNAELQGTNPVTGNQDLFLAEPKYISAILSVLRERAAVVAVTEGHGESAITPAIQLMKDQNFTVETVNTLGGSLSSNVDLLIIPSPKTDFTEQEIETIDAYLKQGKSMQVYLDMTTKPLPRLEAFLAEWGVSVGHDYVLETDPNQVYGMYASNLIPVLSSHPITDSLIQNKISLVLPGCKTITPLWTTRNGITVTELASSSAKAFATEDMQKADNKKGENDKPGPLGLVTISTHVDSGKRTHVLVSGTSGYVTDQKVLEMNRDFLSSALIWMATGEERTNVAAKSLVGPPLNMTQGAILFWSAVVTIVLPLCVLLMGLFVWLRRRHL